MLPHPVSDDVLVHSIEHGISHAGGITVESGRDHAVDRNGYQVRAQNLPVQVVHVSVVLKIDGIGIALDDVTKVVETIFVIVNVDAFAVHINDVATVDDIGDTSVEVFQGLSNNRNPII